MDAIEVANDAAIWLEDPNMGRVSAATWGSIINRVLRKISPHMPINEVEVVFDVFNGISQYSYPTDCLTVQFAQYNSNPSGDPNGYLFLTPMKGDQWRIATNGGASPGDPYNYYPRPSWMNLWPTPAADVTSGGVLCYWALPARVTDITTDTIEAPELVRDHITEGAIGYGLMADRQYAEAKAHLDLWRENHEYVAQLLLNRSSDARPRFVPRVRGHADRQL